jgi:hypothetical protein
MIPNTINPIQKDSQGEGGEKQTAQDVNPEMPISRWAQIRKEG